MRRAKNELQKIGDSSPTNDDLLTQTYYMYNHGSNIPSGYTYDGKLEPTKHTSDSPVDKAVTTAQKNAAVVDTYYDNKNWPCQ